MRTPTLLLLTATLLPGCFISRSTVNEPISAEAVASLVPGETTAAETAALLGAPTDVVQLGRRMAWRYDHSAEKRAALALIVVGLLGTDSHSDRVWVFFDENDVLSHVGSTLAADQAEYALPWSELRRDSE